MPGTPKKKPLPEREGRGSFKLAFCSLMAALGTGLMMTGGLIPVLREYGRRWALLVWTVTALLCLMLCTDKEAAFFYLFLGYYPVLKTLLERVKPRGLALLCKLLFFAVSIGGMYALIALVFQLDVGLEELEELGRWAGIVFYVLLTATMLIYDSALKSLAILYEYRLRPRIKRMK